MEKFQTFGIDENATLTAKINSIVQALNQVGRVSNDVVHDWQKVMEWAMGEGLDESIDKKVEDMVLSGKFDEVLKTSLTDIVMVNVRNFGAKGDGITDDTVSIQNAINSITKGTVLVEGGTFLIKGTDGTQTRNGLSGGVALKSNVNLFIRNATLKVINTNFTDYNIVRCNEISDVIIYGENGTIQGDKLTNTQTTGEWGYGIGIWECQRITIKDLTIKDCWGDSIAIVNRDTVKFSEDVTIDNVICDNNRRQGISICASKRTLVSNSKFSNIRGTLPEAGIDIEANVLGDVLEDTKIINCSFENNGIGLNFRLSKGDLASNCSFRNNDYGVAINTSESSNVSSCIFTDNEVSIIISQSNNSTVSANTVSGTGKGVIINDASTNNDIINNNIDVVGKAIEVSGANDNTVSNNTIGDSSLGIDVYLSNDTVIKGNKMRNNTRHMNINGDNNDVQLNNLRGNDVAVFGNTNIFSNNDIKTSIFYDQGTGTIQMNNRT